jgi:hypothetical protein
MHAVRECSDQSTKMKSTDDEFVLYHAQPTFPHETQPPQATISMDHAGVDHLRRFLLRAQ